MKIVDWALRIVPAAVLLQTLFFKFTGSPESVYIFTQLGVEPWGRWASGLAELVAAILLLLPSAAWAGGLLAMGVMAGAILSHLFVLGVVVQDDGGLLFTLAWVVLVTSATTVYLHRKDLPFPRR
jgi:uncharacterized membrane protein YphA (DoxX/SURF4 family)